VPAANEQTVLVQTSYGLAPIGWVQSLLRVLNDAPNQREGAPRAWIRFDEQVAEGAKDLQPGDEIVVLTWLHLSPRDELSKHPEDDMSQPLTGVFSTCSPNRPNPIGLHRARIVAREGLRVEVDALEAIDGTPVVDVKPAIDRPHDALHAAVLYGDLPARNRMSRWGPTIRPGSNSPLSSSSNAAVGSRTEVSQNAFARSGRPWCCQPEGP
jgi:tRNA-Thr(GGU) m(6)t(6)A37 methyltransferase TsaA